MNRQEPQETETSKPIILVVEDNPDEWFLIQLNLQKHFPQTQAVWLANADDVIPYLETRSSHEDGLPKLIALDLYLPSSRVYIPSAEEGIGVIQALKSHHMFRQIPLVILSRSAHAHDMSEAFKYAANSYVIKPDDYPGWLDVCTEFHKYLLEQGTGLIPKKIEVKGGQFQQNSR